MAMAIKIICIKGHPETGREGTKKNFYKRISYTYNITMSTILSFFTIRHSFSFFIEQILREVLRNNVFTWTKFIFLAKLHSDNWFGQVDGTNWLFHVHTFTFYTPEDSFILFCVCFCFLFIITFPSTHFLLHDSAVYKCGRSGKAATAKKKKNVGKYKRT